MDKQKIVDANQMYVKYFNSGNIDGLARLHTEDAVVMPPNGDFTIGRNKISLVLKHVTLFSLIPAWNDEFALRYIRFLWLLEFKISRSKWYLNFFTPLFLIKSIIFWRPSSRVVEVL